MSNAAVSLPRPAPLVLNRWALFWGLMIVALSLIHI